MSVNNLLSKYGAWTPSSAFCLGQDDGVYCKRSVQSLTKAKTRTNNYKVYIISRSLEWVISQQVCTPYPQIVEFRWGLTARKIIWAETLGSIVGFMIILEYRNWVANTCKIHNTFGRSMLWVNLWIYVGYTFTVFLS